MTKLLRYAVLTATVFIASFTAQSQNVAINNSGATADASGILDVSSTSKGVLVPRMTKAQKAAIATPANALLVYQTGPDSVGFHYYDAPSTSWKWLSNDSPLMDTINWKTKGNLGLTDSTSFFGNQDDVPLNFRQNNVKAGRIDNIRSNVFLGTLAGNDTAVGWVNVGAFSGQKVTNNFAGVNIGYAAGQNITTSNSNSVNIGIFAGQSSATSSTTTQNVFIGGAAGQFNKAGGGNVGIGYLAYRNDTTGTLNTAIGFQSMTNGVVGFENTAVGNYSMSGAKGVSRNVAVGTLALSRHVGGEANTAVGHFSQRDSSKGTYYNTSIGAYSMEFNRTGTYNTGLGLSAMRNSDSSSNNTAVGADALYNHKGVNGSNTALGAFAGRGDSSGYWNTAIGSETMDRVGANNTGSLNTAVGFRALRNIKTGWENTALGVGALEADTSGFYNTAVGRGALFAHLRGSYNTALGFLSGRFADSTYETTTLGTQAGFFNRVPYTTAVGTNAMYHNNIVDDSDPRAGKENTAVGQMTLFSNALGIKNTAVGYHALNSNQLGYWGVGVASSRNTAVGDSAANNTAGNDNVAIGSHSLSKNGFGSQHVAVGSRALFNTTGTYPNTAIGYSSMDSTTTGTANTAVGSYSLTANKTGINNVAVGNAAMFESTAGNNNTAIGNDAGRLIRDDFNTALGASALRNDSTGTNNVAIGYQAAFTADTASAFVAIGRDALLFNREDSNVAIGYRAGRTLGNFGSLYRHKEATFIGTFAGDATFASSKNTAIGFRALAQRSSTGSGSDYIDGGRNTAIGDSAMAFSVGISNVAIGAQAMSNAGVGIFQNVAIGDSAMGNANANSSANFDNVAVGYKSLTQVRNQGNIAMGSYAGQKLANTVWNTAIGYHALEVDTTGSENTVIGTSAFRNNFNGIRNASLGINTGFWNTGNSNTFIGSYSGEGTQNRSTGSANTAVGSFSLQEIRSGGQNVAMGDFALGADTTGSQNVSIGAGSMDQKLRGDGNVAVGFWANRADTAGNLSVAIGREAAYFNQRSETVAIGYRALYNNSTSSTITQAVFNTAVGTSALISNTIGSNNTALGYATNVGANNLNNATAIGYRALVGAGNSMVLGSINGVNGATANTNVGMGTTTPDARLHIVRNGVSGGTYHPAASTIVEDNTDSYIQFSNPNANETGFLSGNATTTIRSGVIFRADSSIQFRSGGNITAMTIDNTNFVGIGNTAPADLLHVGTTTGARIRIGSFESIEDFGANVLAVNANWLPTTDNARSLGTVANRWTTVFATNGTINTSDARDKENIETLNYGIKDLMKLRPVSYTWKENPQWGRKIGFIAQEVQPILKEVVQVGSLKNNKITSATDAENNITTKESDKLGIYYSDIIPVAVKAIQEQQKQIEAQAKENADLKKKNEQLEADIKAIKAKLGIQ